MGTKQAETRNGINISEVRELIGAMSQDAEAGKIDLRTSSKWDDGAAVDGAAKELETAQGTISRNYTFRSDFPVEFGGTESGPVPGELLLAALGACVTSGYVEKAALEGVDISELELDIEGSVDLRGAYEIEETRASLQRIMITLRVHSDAEDALIEEIGRTALRTSPVADSLSSVPIRLTVQRLS